MTWLYIPGLGSTSSACAPAAEGLTAPLNWQSQVLAQSCTWRGSHSPSPLWSRRLKTVSWLRRLSGAMCEPSTADAGAESWIASLAESRASLIASPADAAEAQTSAISGPRLGASSPRPVRPSSSSKTSAASSRRGLTKSLAPSGYGETYRSWVTRLRAASSARRTWASRTNANASSSSAWPTMRAAHGATGSFGLPERALDPASCRIEDTVALFAQQMTKWPTPGTEERSENPETFAARRSKIDPAKRMGPSGTLGMAVQTFSLQASAWPTPAARDFKGVDREEVERKGSRPLNEVVARWSTPRASDGEKGGPNQSFGAGGVPLVAQATKWSTPRVTTGDYTRDRGKKGSERMTLEGEAKWSTPSVADTTGGRKARSGDRSGEMLNNSLAPMVADLASDRQDPETPPPGASSPRTAQSFYQRYRATTDSALRCEMRALRRIARDRRPVHALKKGDDGQWKADPPAGWTPGPASLWVRPAFRRQLNPRFVEWLMSWPPGSTSFECSATALRTHKAAWRSELASMTSLPEAPPAQLSLFG